jgi:CreA protein
MDLAAPDKETTMRAICLAALALLAGPAAAQTRIDSISTNFRWLGPDDKVVVDRYSIACRAVGPVSIPPGLPKSEVIAFASASLFFKTFQVHRAVDAEKQVLVYTVVSTKLINGSPYNSISAVPTQTR